MRKFFNRIYGVILPVLGMIILCCLPPVYNRLDITSLHWVAIYSVVTGIVYTILSLLLGWGKSIR